MPRNPGFAAHMHELTLAERLAQPDRCQERWYRWLAERLSACSALDAGAGTGYGVEILRAARFGVFFSTPNWNQWGSQNPYHIRDYTPEELMGLVG